MMRSHLAFGMITFAALSLSACSVSLIGKASPPPPFLMTLTPTAENAPKASGGSPVRAADVVVISIPTTPEAIAQKRVPVTRSGTAVAYLTGGTWVEQPARLFHRMMGETIRARTGRHVLDLRQFPGDPGVTVSGSLLHMDVEETTKQVVVTYDATAVSSDKRVRTRRFEAREAVSVIDATNVAISLNVAANRVAEEVAAWVFE
jgi:cholesterol transport system auxiliary component